MDDKVVSLIEKFYDNPANVSKNFGGPENFIKFVLSKGDKYSEYLDPKNEFFYDNDLQDLLIWEKYQSVEDKQQFLREFIVEFSDSDMDVESGGKISWVIDKDDVLLAFDDRGRDGTARGAAEMVFNEDYNEHFSDNVINDFYNDVKKIQSLIDAENKQKREILSKRADYKNIVSFLNNLGNEFIMSAFMIEDKNFVKAHNIIKTLIIVKLYKNIEKGHCA